MPRVIPGTVLALAAVLGVAAPALADMGFPGLRRAHLTHQVYSDEAFPDHVFVVYRPKSVYFKDEKTGKEVLRSANEAVYVDVEPGQPAVLPTTDDRIDRIAFMIVPRTASASYKTALELAEAVEAQQVKGATRYDLAYREDVPEWYGSQLTVNYRIRRIAGDPEGRLEVVRTTWDQGYQCCVAGIACPVGCVFSGLWLVRRWVRRPR